MVGYIFDWIVYLWVEFVLMWDFVFLFVWGGCWVWVVILKWVVDWLDVVIMIEKYVWLLLLVYGWEVVVFGLGNCLLYDDLFGCGRVMFGVIC